MNGLPQYLSRPHLDQAVSAGSPWAARRPRFERRLLHRLRKMPFSEIAYRGRQEASKWLDRLSADGRQVEPHTVLLARASELAGADAALNLVRERAPLRFFPGIGDPATTDALQTRLVDECRKIIAAADMLSAHRFNLLGYRSLWFGDPIDWHLDPVSLRRAPLEHWSRIDYLSTHDVGDSKVIWELNRHQWVVRMAQAWALTGHERYATACIDAIESWIDANPPGIGINWASSLEVAYRLMSWCWAVLLIRHSRAISGRWTMKLLAAIWLHATHVRRYLSYYFSPNTHLTGEALGLFYAGTLFPEFEDAWEWRDLGASVLIAEARSQLSPDGVHFELSTCYHIYTIETYLHFMLLAARNDIAVPLDLRERVGLMVEFLLAMRRPDGLVPAIGDDDGGSLLPLSQRSRGDARGVFGVAASVLHRSDFSWAAGGMTPEVLWLMGSDGQRAFDSVRPGPPAGEASRVFPSAGYAVMRTGWKPDAHHMIVDVGPLGCHISSGHGHADLLSIQCSAFGDAFLVDAGTYCYTSEPHWREFFRSTGAHSSVVVDGQGQAQGEGPFAWRHRPRAQLRCWLSNADHEFVDAEHDAYLSLADPIGCRRRVIFVKRRFWIVVDDLSGSSSHQIDLTFQFAPVQVAIGPHAWTRAESQAGHVLWISSFQSAPVQTSLKSGELSPIRGWVSPDYGQRQPAPMLVYSSRSTLPWRALTLLLPDEHASICPPDVHPLFDDDHRPTGITLTHLHTTVRFADQEVFIT